MHLIILPLKEKYQFNWICLTPRGTAGTNHQSKTERRRRYKIIKWLGTNGGGRGTCIQKQSGNRFRKITGFEGKKKNCGCGFDELSFACIVYQHTCWHPSCSRSRDFFARSIVYQHTCWNPSCSRSRDFFCSFVLTVGELRAPIKKEKEKINGNKLRTRGKWN